MNFRLIRSLVAAACALTVGAAAHSQSQLLGDTYFISYDIDTFSYGRYGYADVGQTSSFVEFYRGFVQFDLSGQTAAGRASLSFDYRASRSRASTRPKRWYSIGIGSVATIR